MWFEDDSRQLGHLGQRLRSNVTQTAAVVCSTASNDGEFVMRCNTNRAKLVIFDEAAHAAEHLTLRILINKCRDLDGVLFVGDPAQARPLSLSRKENHVFRDHLKSTLMGRLVVTGFKMEFFNTQHRMHPVILAIVNKITYKDRLLIADPLKVENLPADALPKQLKNFNQEKFRRNINMLYLDYREKPMLPVAQDGSQPLTHPNQTKISNKSRYNEYFLIDAVNLAYDLLKKFPKVEIGLLTAYGAQNRLALSAKDKMIAADPNDRLSIEERLYVSTRGASQGKEYDIVIVDILILDSESRDSAQALTTSQIA